MIDQKDKPTHQRDERPAESALSASTGSEWRPIATAPKDGTKVIVGYDFATVWIAHVAFYSTGTVEAKDGTIVELWKDQGMDFLEEAVGWWSYVENSVSQHKLEGYNAPTHWIPLPSLPNVEHE